MGYYYRRVQAHLDSWVNCYLSHHIQNCLQPLLQHLILEAFYHQFYLFHLDSLLMNQENYRHFYDDTLHRTRNPDPLWIILHRSSEMPLIDYICHLWILQLLQINLSATPKYQDHFSHYSEVNRKTFCFSDFSQLHLPIHQ